MDNIQLRKSILNFSLDNGPHGNQGYSRVLLQLFGYTGHGKSSFINSCKYVVDEEEEYIKYAKAGDREDGASVTRVRDAYELTETITMVDNRGFSSMDSFERAEVYAQLGNYIPIGERVKWEDDYAEMIEKIEESELDPNYSDLIIPILIYSAIRLPNPHEKEELKHFMRNCEDMTGVVPIIVITRKKSGDFMEVERQFRLMGAEIVIAIENYTNEDQIKTCGRTTDILTVLHQALKHVAFRLRQVRNQRSDWVQRKIFLLDYIHQADQEKREQQWRRKEQERRAKERRQEEERRAKERKKT
ncbi:hypothetical protein PRIEUP_LOCUS764 [Pristimantis euphronides]